MKKIQLWSVDRTEDEVTATPVESVDNTETEQNLEALLVASPDLPMNNLTLVLPPRATQDGSPELDDFCAAVPSAIRDKNQYTGLEISFGEAAWTTLAVHLDTPLGAVVTGWRQRSSGNGDTDDET